MIERLELHRWRAFDRVGIDLTSGTTFLVAPNGVGKTSLLLGLTWGLFGEHSNVDAKSCVRVGHDEAVAVVNLLLGDGRRLVIHRTITTTGKADVECRLDEQLITPADADGLLVAEFGAPIEIAARLAVIRGSGKDDGELQLREHLYDAFGVSGLRRAAASASKLHKDAVAARKKLRTASRTRLANRSELAATAGQLQRELDSLGAERDRLVASLSQASRIRRAASEWSDYDATLDAHAHAVSRVLEEAAAAGLAANALDDLLAATEESLAAIKSREDEARARQGEARAQALAARAALDLLEGHDPSCPTCARPFHGDELDRAVAAQGDSFDLAQSRLRLSDEELRQLSQERDGVEAIRAEAMKLRVAPAQPDSPRPTGDVEAVVAAAGAALQQHDERTGRVASERDAIATQLASDVEMREAYEAELVAWRREALSQAATAALTGTAERLAEDYIEPLSEQVRWRWKALFGEDGLQLRPDGTIVRVVGDRELPWSQLSSGEQLWARLVASLLVLRSSTKLPFAWLDEPLEHLDPRARRIVATDLATSTQAGRPRQLIVTTYEHTLARQLSEDLPDTYIRQINRSEAVELPPRRRAEPPDADDADVDAEPDDSDGEIRDAS